MNRLVASGSLLVLLAACGAGDKPSLNTTVVDPWGNPVEGVNVTAKDSEKSFTTDAEGVAKLPLAEQTFELTAGGEGFIPGKASVEVTDAKTSIDTKLTVIPVPGTAGYHFIGDSAYVTLAPQPVKNVGNELMSQYGTPSAGDTFSAAETLRVVFNTPLPKDELARLDLELHKLTFLEEMEMKTAEGIEEVEVDLWVSTGKIAFNAEQLGDNDDNYVFTLSNLEPGAYAFVTSGLLRPASPADFAANPVKNVHAFRVK